MFVGFYVIKICNIYNYINLSILVRVIYLYLYLCDYIDNSTGKY